MNAHRRRRPDQVEAAPQEGMSQADADTEAAKAPTVSELWERRAAILVKDYEAAEDDLRPSNEQDEIEWAMVRTPSTLRYEVVHKLEVIRYWWDIGRTYDRRELLLLESAIRDLNSGLK